MLISDGPSYIVHAFLYDVDFTLPQVYGYPLYWLFVDVFGEYFGYFFPNFLSLVIFLFLFLIIRRISTANIFLFLFFLMLNPLIFNSMFVALKNGLALAVLMYGLVSSKKLCTFGSIAIHPGVAPLSLLSIIFNKRVSVYIKIFLGLLGLFLMLYSDTVNDVMMSRGYDGFVAGQEMWSVYFVYLLFGVFYYLAFKSNPYRYFFIVLVLFWLILGRYYPFAWRFFSQAMVVALLILLIKSDRSQGKFLFLISFTALSIYSTLEWHPLIEYSQGWLGYWLTFI